MATPERDPYKPTRYDVTWEDWGEAQRLAAKRGEDVNDVDPADYWHSENASETLAGAIAKAKALNLRLGYDIQVRELVGLREDPTLPAQYAWDWDDAREVGYVRDGQWNRED